MLVCIFSSESIYLYDFFYVVVFSHVLFCFKPLCKGQCFVRIVPVVDLFTESSITWLCYIQVKNNSLCCGTDKRSLAKWRELLIESNASSFTFALLMFCAGRKRVTLYKWTRFDELLYKKLK